MRIAVLGILAASAAWPSDTLPSIIGTKQLGGSGFSQAGGMARDAQGNLYVAGTTDSVDLAATVASFGPRDSNLYQFSPSTGTVESVLLPISGEVTALAVPSNGSNVVYAATRIAIARSNDSGRTWRIVAPVPAYVSALAVDPVDVDVLYAAGEHLWKSLDGGRTWIVSEQDISGDKPPVRAARILPHPRRAKVAFAVVTQATGLEGLLFRSNDAGEHWIRQSTDAMQIAFDRRRPGIIFAVGRRTFYKSTDDGDTWNLVSTPTDMGLPGRILIDPARPRTVYVQNGTLLLRSTDDGATWESLSHPGNLEFVDASGALCESGGPDGLLVSRDAGTTWTPLKGPKVSTLVMLNDGRVLIGTRRSKDVFVAKLTPDGEVIWATYMGGSQDDSANAIAVDPAGGVYVAGYTQSTDLPATTSFESQIPTTLTSAIGLTNGRPFVVKLSADGKSVVYSMLFVRSSAIADVAVDTAGNAYFAGTTTAPVPVTAGAIWPEFDFTLDTSWWQFASVKAQAFAGKLDSSGSNLLYCTYLRAHDVDEARSVAIDRHGSAYVAGTALWKLSPDATRLIFSTRLGYMNQAVLGSDGNLYVGGETRDSDFRTSPGALSGATGRDAFVAKFSPAGDLLASRTIGGERHDSAITVAIASDGSVVAGGAAESFSFPTRGVLDMRAGAQSGWSARLSADLSNLSFASYFGSWTTPGVTGIVADGSSGVWSLLTSTSENGEARVMLIRTDEPERGQRPRIDAVLNEASMYSEAVAPGERVLIRGVGFGSHPRVRLGDGEAQVLSAADTEIVATVPAVPDRTSLPLRIESDNRESQSTNVRTAVYAPSIYTVDRSGSGQVLAFNADGSANAEGNPAPRGSMLTVVVNGFGPVVFDDEVPAPAKLTVYMAGGVSTDATVKAGAVLGMTGPVTLLKFRVPEPSTGAITQYPARTYVNLVLPGIRGMYRDPQALWIWIQ